MALFGVTSSTSSSTLTLSHRLVQRPLSIIYVTSYLWLFHILIILILVISHYNRFSRAGSDSAILIYPTPSISSPSPASLSTSSSCHFRYPHRLCILL